MWLGTLRGEANEEIKRWARSDSRKGKVLYVDAAALVPFEVGALWEPDGLHMSRMGYKQFGKRLAPLVTHFLWAGLGSSVEGGASNGKGTEL